MSIMCCVYVPEGIVMAAESRLTRTKPTSSEELPQEDDKAKKVIQLKQTTYTLTDNAQKVVLLKKSGVGVSFCGNAVIQGKTVADFIRNFEIEKVLETDTTSLIAQKLSEYYSSANTIFFVCGYDADIPYVYEVLGGNVKRYNLSKKENQQSDKNDAAATEEETLTGTPENASTPIAVEEEKVVFGAIWAGRDTAITKIVNNTPVLNAAWSTMPLRDAIDFAEFLIDTTIKYERFCDDIQTCGGDIDILVITKDEAFWQQHKVFNPKN